jgi:CelD/BcsL family acetyltransferase involved in cellulose biosynthesis
MHLKVRLLTDIGDVLAHSAAWDQLAGPIPFRSSSWIAAWWRHYGSPTNGAMTRQLFVPTVFDDRDQLMAVAPWSRRFSLTEGWTLEWLGGGEACSDYLGLLADGAKDEAVVELLADWLCDECRDVRERWDQIWLDSVDPQDGPTVRLVEALKKRRCLVHRRNGPCCWRLRLPTTWDNYLERLSKSHRKQVRRRERNMLESGRAQLHTVTAAEVLPQAFDILVDLHQRRRAFLGQPGRFSSLRFTAVHRDVSRRLAEHGRCAVHWLEIDGCSAAAEYHFIGNGLNFAYQSGIDPQRLEQEPGNLITVALVKQAIERGDRAIDFLRGDEAYKSHFRAEPRPIVRYRIAAPRWQARCRLLGWSAARSVKNWLVAQ